MKFSHKSQPTHEPVKHTSRQHANTRNYVPGLTTYLLKSEHRSRANCNMSSCANRNDYEIITCYLYTIAHQKPSKKNAPHLLSLTRHYPKHPKTHHPENALTSTNATIPTTTKPPHHQKTL